MFHIYGLLIGFSVLILIWVSELLLLKGGKDKRLIGEAVSFILFPALIGARVYHVIHLWEYYSSNLTAIWRIWEGGLAIWGAVIGGMIGIMLFSRKKARDVEERAVEIFLTLADVLAIVMPLAQSVGRMGNFFNEELYGRETDLPWGIVVSGREGVYHPLFAYEAILNLVLFVILLTLFGKKSGRGGALGGYLFGYGVIRILLEPLREGVWTYQGLPVAIIVSVFSIIIGGLLLIRHRKWVW